MKLKIQQYRLWPDIDNNMELPIGATVIHVGDHFGDIFLWALVDTEATETETHRIHIVETGKALTDDVQRWTYITTYANSVSGGAFHVYEEKPPSKAVEIGIDSTW